MRSGRWWPAISAQRFPTSRLSIVNNTAVHDTRIDGRFLLNRIRNGTGASTTLNFKFLGVRTIANSNRLNYGSTTGSAPMPAHRLDRQIRFWRRFRFRR